MIQLLTTSVNTDLSPKNVLQKVSLVGRDNYYNLCQVEVDIDQSGNVLLISSDRMNIPHMGVTPFEFADHPTVENWVEYTENPKFILNRLITMGFSIKVTEKEKPALIGFINAYPFDLL